MSDVQVPKTTIEYIRLKLKVFLSDVVQPIIDNVQSILQAEIDAFTPNTSKSGLTATGADQAGALVLTRSRNRLDTVAPGTGTKEDRGGKTGWLRTVQNNGANDLLHYPFLGDNFYVIGVGAMAANAPFTISSGNQATFFCYDDGTLTLI